MDEILADYNEAELEQLAGFLQKVTAAGVIATVSDRGMPSHRGQHPPMPLPDFRVPLVIDFPSFRKDVHLGH
jgi:hypothetical protein